MDIKKILSVAVIVIVAAAILITGKNFINSRHNKDIDYGDMKVKDGTVYYKLEEYVDQGFYVINAQETADGKVLVRLTTDGEREYIDSNYSMNIEPNSYIETVITKEQYDKWINGHECFRGTLDVLTVCVPIKSEETDALFYTYIDPDIDLEKCVNEAYSDAQNGPGYGEGRIGGVRKIDDINKYLDKWQFAKTII